MNDQGHSLGVALLFVAVGVLCLFADHFGDSVEGPAATRLGRSARLWRWHTVLLWLMAINSLVQGDVLFVIWMREAFQAAGWYGVRRPLQAATLAALLTASALAFKTMAPSNPWAQPARLPLADKLAGSGMALLLLMLTLRFVSLHYTDEVLNLRLAGPSLGRWLEMAGLVLVGSGAFWRLVRIQSPQP
jgi:hypothetical protein